MIDVKVIKNFLICSAGSLILKIISSLIVLVSISFIEPEQYGLLSLANTFIAIFPIFLNLGLRQAFGLDFFHLNNAQRHQMLNDVISIYLITSLPVLIFSIFNLDLINKYIFLNKAGNHLVFIVVIICFLHFFVELFFQFLRYQTRIFQLSSLQILMGIINSVFALFFLYFSNLKIVGILIANLISNLFILSKGIGLYKKEVKSFSFNILKNKSKIYYYLKTGFPFIPNIFFNWLISFGDRWVLTRSSSLNEVGIYSLADSFGLLFQLLVLTPLTSSYIPYLFEKFANNKNDIDQIDKQNQKAMWLSMLSTFVAVTILFFSFKKILYLILPIKYLPSIKFIWLILVEQIIYMGSYFATCYLTFYKKTYYLVTLTLFSSILNLILNIFLVPFFSITGCIYAGMISYTVYLFGILIVTNFVKNKVNSKISHSVQS